MQAVQHIGSDRLFLYRIDKLFYYFKADIRFEESHLHFLKSRLDVCFR